MASSRRMAAARTFSSIFRPSRRPAWTACRRQGIGGKSAGEVSPPAAFCCSGPSRAPAPRVGSLFPASPQKRVGGGPEASGTRHRSRQLAASPMMLFARRLENALIQKRLHEANAAVAAFFLSGVTEYPRGNRSRPTLPNNVRCWEQSGKHLLGVRISHIDPERKSSSGPSPSYS